MVAVLARNESQDKTFHPKMVEENGWHDRVYMDDYQPDDQLAVYIYRDRNGGIEQGYIEKIDISGDKVKQELTPELMGADGNKHDVMVVSRVKIAFLGMQWDRDISASAQLIDKGAELFVPF